MQTDVCIVGSGAAGIALARQLDGSKKQVLVLEAGGLARDREVEDDAFAIEYLGVPYSNPCASRGRWFGGSTNLWFGRIAMFDPVDLELRSWVPHSGWPLSYDELSPWANKAAELLAVPNFERMRPESWRGHPAFDTFVTRGGANIGVFVWADGLYMAPYHRAALEASHNVKLLFDATTTQLVPSENSRTIEHIEVLGPSGQRFRIKASTYVLAAGGFENPRLLLASTARSEKGIGNEHDLVGRFYMDHPRTQSFSTVELGGLSASQIEMLQMFGEHTSGRYGKAQFRLTFPADLQREEGLLNHAMHADFASDVHSSEGFAALKRLTGRLSRKKVDNLGHEIDSSLAGDLSATLRGAPKLLEYGLQKLRKQARPSQMFLHDQMEQEPDPASRVSVDFSRRDRWGLPRLQLDWRIGASTYRSQRRMHQLLKDVLERSGIRSFHSPLLEDPACAPDLMEMKHPSGTTRMSREPATGVVDPNLRVHGVENLYVVGSSTFPTVGHANPTLAIVALAARLAHHLGQQR